MMKLYKNNVRLAKKIARGTICSGIIFLLGLYFTHDFTLTIGGIFFGLGVFLIVITLLASDLITAKRQNFSSREKTVTIFWNVLTLGVLILFTLIGLKLANSSRIVIKNNTSQEIKNVFISGCQNFEVGTIPANSSETIIIDYGKNETKDCEIGIRYTTPVSIEDDLIDLKIKLFQGERVVYEINE